MSQIPDVPLTPFILRHAERLANKPALIDGPSGRCLTYGSWPTACGAWPRSGAAGLPQGRRLRQVYARTRRSSPSPSTGSPRSADRRRRSIRSAPPRRCTASSTDSGATLLLTVPERLDTVREPRPDAGSGDFRLRGRPGATRRSPRFSSTPTLLPAVAINPAEDVVGSPLLERHDRTAQGRDADPPQPGRAVLNRGGSQTVAEDDTVVSVSPLFHIAGMPSS